MGDANPLVHLVAGGVGGTVGAIVTSPLDVVKTRLQSNCSHWNGTHSPSVRICPNTGLPIDPRRTIFNKLLFTSYSTATPVSQIPRQSLLKCLRYIYRTEGAAGLFRGLAPNLVGVAPSRAIYFCAYAKSKELYSGSIYLTDNSSMVHLLSAATAGFIGCTITNPLWFIKTRLQLDQHQGINRLTVWRCISQVYNAHGLKGFYKGLTASYFGISETVLNFVIYEKLKEKILLHARTVDMEHDRSPVDFAEFLIASGISKTIACVSFYPHEVARTRMRQEGNIYRTFWQTLAKVVADEGWQGLYKGLFTQLVRAIPNTAIMMSTYELTVYFLSQHSKPDDDDKAELFAEVVD